jgi:hypothetical protein
LGENTNSGIAFSLQCFHGEIEGLVLFLTPGFSHHFIFDPQATPPAEQRAVGKGGRHGKKSKKDPLSDSGVRRGHEPLAPRMSLPTAGLTGSGSDYTNRCTIAGPMSNTSVRLVVGCGTSN